MSSGGPRSPTAKGGTPRRSAAEQLVADAWAMKRLATRMQARLLERSLASLGEAAAALVSGNIHRNRFLVSGGRVRYDWNVGIIERFRTTIELAELAEGLMRQNLRRAHPDANEHDIDAMLTQWLELRPGAEHGDAVGTPVTLPRSTS